MKAAGGNRLHFAEKTNSESIRSERILPMPYGTAWRPCTKKYAAHTVTDPLLPAERGGLSFIDFKTAGKGLGEWVNDPQIKNPVTDGDHLIAALVRLDLEFVADLSWQIFDYRPTWSPEWVSAYQFPQPINRTGLEILAACLWGEGGHHVDCTLTSDFAEWRKGQTLRKHLTALIWREKSKHRTRVARKQQYDHLKALIS